jgi:hypothetical protein
VWGGTERKCPFLALGEPRACSECQTTKIKIMTKELGSVRDLSKNLLEEAKLGIGS